MNDYEVMNVQQIIRRGNSNLARVWLQATFLGADLPDDVLLVECTLTKLETSRGTQCKSGREALNRAYLILDEITVAQTEKTRLLERWQSLDNQFRCSET
jgi:hypothetical protein